jgi:hypothetical protein
MTAPPQWPRTDNTMSPPIRFSSPVPDIIASPGIRFRPPVPDISASGPIRSRPPIPNISATPPLRFRPSIPDIIATPKTRFVPPIPDVTASASTQPTLNVSPSPPVEAGKPVVFEVVLYQPPPPGWNLQYRFDFGDGTTTDWTSERQITHTYSSAGNRSYPVHVEIGSTYRDRVMPAKQIDQTIDVIAPLNPTPSATESVPITPSPIPETTPSPTISPSPTPTAFSSPSATVSPTETAFSSPATTSPPPSSSKMPWLYIVGVFAAIGLARLAYAKWKPKIPIVPPLAFYPHADWDAPQLPPKNMSIKYGLYFLPNVSASQDRLKTDGGGSILREKKQ